AKTRTEEDALGKVEVPAEHLWGAQTQRSIDNFPIGRGRFRLGRRAIRAFGLVKKCAALANRALGQLPAETADLIARAADEVIAGRWDDEFQLVVFQTGSGTQSNMNANEVIANRAIQLAGGVIGTKKPIHPNDDVNRGQSSNDVFPTVMHVATVDALTDALLPTVAALRDTLDAKARAYADMVMIGRTHLQDATPLTVGQMISGWVAQLDETTAGVRATLPGLYALALGGTAVGTGLNAHPEFGGRAAAEIARETGQPFVPARNAFAALAGHDAMVATSGALLAEAVRSFDERCARGLEPDARVIAEHVERSLMLVTALVPHIGYEKAAKIALTAHHEHLSLREAALKLGYVTSEQFDRWVR